MAQYSAQLDGVFVALADPTRRAVIRRLGPGPTSVGELAREFPMTLPSFLKHVRTLEASGLIRTTKSGRVRTCVLDRERLALVEDWLAEQRRVWAEPHRSARAVRHRHTERSAMNPDLDLALQRVIRAPRSVVWRAWTDPSQLATVVGPRADAVVRVDRLEARPAAPSSRRSATTAMAFGPHIDASFLVVDDAERLVFTNAVDSRWRPTRRTRSRWSPRSSSATTRTAPTTGSSSATATPPPARRHEELGFFDGWGAVTGQLAALVEGAAVR